MLMGVEVFIKLQVKFEVQGPETLQCTQFTVSQAGGTAKILQTKEMVGENIRPKLNFLEAT